MFQKTRRSEKTSRKSSDVIASAFAAVGGTLATVALLSWAAPAAAAPVPGMACGSFYCSASLTAERHAGDSSSAVNSVYEYQHGHRATGGYQNWHDYASSEYMEESSHDHFNCQGPGNGGTNGGSNGGDNGGDNGGSNGGVNGGLNGGDLADGAGSGGDAGGGF